jgi:hypothetical protein
VSPPLADLVELSGTPDVVFEHAGSDIRISTPTDLQEAYYWPWSKAKRKLYFFRHGVMVVAMPGTLTSKELTNEDALAVDEWFGNMEKYGHPAQRSKSIREQIKQFIDSRSAE